MDDREVLVAETTESSVQQETGEDVQMANATPHEDTTPSLAGRGPSRPIGNPEIVRRAPDIPSAAGRRPDSEGERKKLTVGREIVLSGEINSCDHLAVEGRVEANISDCRALEIAESGVFKGEAEIDVADISGHFEGTLTANQLLLVRSTGRVTGNVSYGQLEIERGGEVTGDLHSVETGAMDRMESVSAAE